MISVQNHPQQLSGNKKQRNMYKNILAGVCLIALFAVSSCTPKTTGVLRNPNVPGGNVGRDQGVPKSEGEKKDEKVEDHLEKKTNIALLLPFQLNKLAPSNITEEDIKRSALALDFYQGFKLGVEETSKKAGDYKISILDTEDSELKNVTLAATPEVEQANIIIGPVFPKEIRSFSKGLVNKKVLQVSPLAASMPTEFNLSNLVSITPPIRVHMLAIANLVASDYHEEDVVLIFDGRDNDHRQFIAGFEQELKKKNPLITIIHADTETELKQSMPDVGTAFVVSGTTQREKLRSLISTLNNQIDDGSTIKLFGHPLWERFDFKPFDNFYRMQPTISAESHLKVWNSEVQNFQRSYKSNFKVEPSDYAYKGYDAGRYFVTLINKYGADYAEKVAEEEFAGLYSDYQFVYNQQWGFVNQKVILKTYRNGSFQ